MIKRTEELIIYYDYDCSFCFRGCIFLKRLLGLKTTKLASVQSDREIEKLSLKENTWVVLEQGSGAIFLRSAAFWRLVKDSRFHFFYPISKIPGILFLGDIIYTFVANNRPRTCTVDQEK